MCIQLLKINIVKQCDLSYTLNNSSAWIFKMLNMLTVISHTTGIVYRHLCLDQQFLFVHSLFPNYPSITEPDVDAQNVLIPLQSWCQVSSTHLLLSVLLVGFRLRSH